MRYWLRSLLIISVYVPLLLAVMFWIVTHGDLAEALFDGLGTAVALVVVIVSVSVGVWQIIHAVRQIRFWPKVNAVVLRYWITRSENKPDGQRFYHPVLRFKTLEGHDVTSISPSGYWRRTWRKGDRLVVRYNPERPCWTEIASIWNLWGIPFLLIVLPVGFVIVEIWWRW